MFVSLSLLTWLILLGLGYLLAQCVLVVLISRLRHEMQVHNLARESRLIRKKYLDALAERIEVH